MNLVGEKRVNARYERLDADRKKALMYRFSPSQQRQLHFSSRVEGVPFNGYSLYEITCKGDFPEALRKDYNTYNNLNESVIRETFRSKRRFRDIFF